MDGTPLVPGGGSPSRQPCVLWALALAPVGAQEPIKVGILHSLSGTMAISEAPIKEVVLMAMDEINQAGRCAWA